MNPSEIVDLVEVATLLSVIAEHLHDVETQMVLLKAGYGWGGTEERLTEQNGALLADVRRVLGKVLVP